MPFHWLAQNVPLLLLKWDYFLLIKTQPKYDTLLSPFSQLAMFSFVLLQYLASKEQLPFYPTVL